MIQSLVKLFHRGPQGALASNPFFLLMRLPSCCTWYRLFQLWKGVVSSKTQKCRKSGHSKLVSSGPLIDSCKISSNGLHFCSPMMLNTLYLTCGSWVRKSWYWGLGPHIIGEFHSNIRFRGMEGAATRIIWSSKLTFIECRRFSCYLLHYDPLPVSKKFELALPP